MPLVRVSNGGASSFLEPMKYFISRSNVATPQTGNIVSGTTITSASVSDCRSLCGIFNVAGFVGTCAFTLSGAQRKAYGFIGDTVTQITEVKDNVSSGSFSVTDYDYVVFDLGIHTGISNTSFTFTAT